MDQKLTLFELNQKIEGILNEAFPSTLWVVAEVSEMKVNRSGHCYLELVEKEGKKIIARARGIIWSYTYRILQSYFETTTGQSFSHGLKILVQVSVSYHPVYGMSLVIKDIDPAYTIGDMAIQRKEIIERLQKEGVFDMNRELELPLVPQKIAVISAGTAAGYHDFIHQLAGNQAGIRFYTCLFEAYMQGNEAVPSIIHALERIYPFEDFFDAIAIIRGGGATADLSSFDNYELALNIAQFPLPVITGIGHEKDDTVIDMVAHKRLKTPTAVAEFFISGAEQFVDRLKDLELRMVSITRELVQLNNQKLERIAEDIFHLVSRFIDVKRSQLTGKGNKFHREVNRFTYNRKYELNNLQHNLKSCFSLWQQSKKDMFIRRQQNLGRLTRERLYREENKCSRIQEKYTNQIHRFLTKEGERLRLNESSVRLLNPQNVLRRGYTLTMKAGKIIKSAMSLSVDDEIETRFADGEIKSTITKKESYDQ